MAAAKTKKAKTTKKAAPAQGRGSKGKISVHDALVKALDKGAATSGDLAKQVTKMRGRESSAGLLNRYLKADPRYRQNKKSGAWTLVK